MTSIKRSVSPLDWSEGLLDRNFFMLQVSLDRCAQCGDCIREGAVMVSGKSYHPHCFTCSECGVVIDQKFYTTEDKKFLCEHDYKVST